MNILFVNDIPFNPHYGGIERVTDSLVRELILRKHNVFYLCGKVYDKKSLEFNFPVSQDIMPEIGLFSSINNREFYNDYLIKNKIDVVINQRGLESDFNLSLLDVPNTKFISVVHSTPLAYMYSAIYSYLLPHNSVKDKIKNVIKTCFMPLYRCQKKKVHRIWQKKHYEELVRKSDRVVLLSEKYKCDLNFCKDDVLFEKIVAIPNPNSFPKQINDFNNKRNIVLFSGRLSSEKNPMALLKAWKRIYKVLPTWELWFVGYGELYNKINSYIDNNCLERVKLCGRQSNMQDYYHQAKIICMTSYYEGWGMALTEGMQCGCVPIAFNSYAAASDIIDDGINGILVSPFKIKELASAIYKLANNDVLLEQYARSACEKTFKYDISLIVDKWERLIMSI